MLLNFRYGPARRLGGVLLFGFVFGLMLVGPISTVFAQQEQDSEPKSAEEFLNQPLEGEAFSGEQGDGQDGQLDAEEVSETTSINFGEFFVKFLVAIVAIGAALWGVLKLLQKTGVAGVSNDLMSIQSTLALGQNQNVQIVRVGEQYFMFGVTDQSVQMLGELEDEKTLKELRINGGDSGDKEEQQGFGSLLKKLTGNREFGQDSDSDQQSGSSSPESFEDLRRRITDIRKKRDQVQ